MFNKEENPTGCTIELVVHYVISNLMNGPWELLKMVFDNEALKGFF